MLVVKEPWPTYQVPALISVASNMLETYVAEHLFWARCCRYTDLEEDRQVKDLKCEYVVEVQATGEEEVSST